MITICQVQEVIMEIQTGVSAALLRKKIGSVQEVVVEGYNKKHRCYVGRSAQDAPEIDGLVYFKSAAEYRIGDFINVKIEKSSDYDLYGVTVES